LKKKFAYDIIIDVKTMGKDKRYPEKHDIRAIAILLATQGMIHLGEIADPLHGRKAINMEGAGFFVDLLAELKNKTRGNLESEEASFISETLENLQKIIQKKRNSANG
jgi:predicted CopG family antitoxin